MVVREVTTSIIKEKGIHSTNVMKSEHAAVVELPSQLHYPLQAVN